MDCWDEGIKVFERGLNLLIYFCCICIIFSVGYFFGSRNNNVTSPVEEIIKADSLVKVNDSIKIKVNNLDSIKNAKIIEVQTLDNDSTAKLFYELINK